MIRTAMTHASSVVPQTPMSWDDEVVNGEFVDAQVARHYQSCSKRHNQSILNHSESSSNPITFNSNLFMDNSVKKYPIMDIVDITQTSICPKMMPMISR